MPKSSNWLLRIGIRFTPATALINELIGIIGLISLLLEVQAILGIIQLFVSSLKQYESAI